MKISICGASLPPFDKNILKKSYEIIKEIAEICRRVGEKDKIVYEKEPKVLIRKIIPKIKITDFK